MAETTGISWCDRTWSPWFGCTKVSIACDGCYAENLMDLRYGKVTWGPHGERVRSSAGYWRNPRKWDREAAAAGRRFTVFPSLCDPFDNRADPAIRAEWFALMRETPHLVWLLLTKRPQNIVAMCEAAGGLPENAALGATCENQEIANRNVRHLLDAARDLYPLFTFVSAEPLLGPIDFTKIIYGTAGHYTIVRDALRPSVIERIDWVITGGETDQGKHRARPTATTWLRQIRDACTAAGVPYHHKQNGEWQGGITARDGEPGQFALHWAEAPGRWSYLDYGPRQFAMFGADARMTRVGKKAAGRLLDGVEHNGFPEGRS